MKYKNTKTGAIIDSPCNISGGDWVAEETTIAIKVEAEAEAKRVKAKETIEKVEVSEESIDEITVKEITVKEIKQELDAMGIKYDPKARKQELYNLMIGK